MQKIRSYLIPLLMWTVVTTSLQGEEVDFEGLQDYSPAYQEGSYSAHWSAYVPLTLMAVAAVYLVFADNQHENHSSKSSSSSYQKQQSHHQHGFDGWSNNNSNHSNYASYKYSDEFYSSYRGRSRCRGHFCHH